MKQNLNEFDIANHLESLREQLMTIANSLSAIQNSIRRLGAEKVKNKDPDLYKEATEKAAEIHKKFGTPLRLRLLED